MILKLKRGSNWLYIDNILNLTVEGMGSAIKDNEEGIVSLVYSRLNKSGIVAQEAIDCNDIAFLLNDNGKTIEKFI